MTENMEPINWQDTKNFLSDGAKLGGVINSAPTMPSTQTPAKEAARNGAPHGTVFVTDFQNSGRGRRDREWTTGPGMDLTFSLILRPALEPRYAHLLNLAAALSVGNVLEKFFSGCGGAVGIKWPNDVMAGGKKICGIICETAGAGTKTDYAVLGIGVNANGTESDMPVLDSPDRPRATSIFMESGRRADLPRLLGGILSELGIFSEMAESDAGRAKLIELYREKSCTLGKSVKVVTEDGEMSGTATGITADGALAVTGNDGRVSVFRAADVVHARMVF
jgi:BirA family biotin operon repressor/biotin-[acetyl-CoA-carboxylase] ligase